MGFKSPAPQALTFSVAPLVLTTCVVLSDTAVLHTAPHASASRHSGWRGPAAAPPANTRLKVMCAPASTRSRCSRSTRRTSHGSKEGPPPAEPAPDDAGVGACAEVEAGEGEL